MAIAIDSLTKAGGDELTEAELDTAIAELVKRINTPKTKHLTVAEIVRQCEEEGLFRPREIENTAEYVQELRRQSHRTFTRD